MKHLKEYYSIYLIGGIFLASIFIGVLWLAQAIESLTF